MQEEETPYLDELVVVIASKIILRFRIAQQGILVLE